MWEPMARALGWPNEQIGSEDLLAFARSDKGWAAPRPARVRRVQLVRTNPEFWTSAYSPSPPSTSRPPANANLVKEDIDGAAGQTVQAIERSIVHYGDTTLFIADRMREGGMSYASAAAMEEVALLNSTGIAVTSRRLVAIYPEGGHLLLRQPFLHPEQDLGRRGGAGGCRGVWLVPRRTGDARGRRSIRLSPA